MTRKECREPCDFNELGARLQLSLNKGALGAYENERGSSFSERCKQWRRLTMAYGNKPSGLQQSDKLKNPSLSLVTRT